MPRRLPSLKRYYGAGYLHFITSSCYQRRALLGAAQRRKLFFAVLEQVRRRYDFVVVSYVVMPEHFHLLISEPERGPSGVMQVLKQHYAYGEPGPVLVNEQHPVRLKVRNPGTGLANQKKMWR